MALSVRLMQNIKLTIEYDGTGFAGWQVQANGRSIQEELEKAIGQIVQEEAKTAAAGRTDAGVHAKGQVVSVRLSRAVDTPSLMKGLNALLPPQIVVLSAEQVDDGFHARHSARARIYQYILALKHTAINRDHSWYVGGYRLDLEVLQECASMLLGEHDFESFCKNNSGVDHFRCSVEEANWTAEESCLIFRIRANRFLHGMVRALVGTMVEIGRGHRPLADFARILEAKDRTVAGMAAPAKGLFLQEIVY